MCKCEANIKTGEYSNQSILNLPEHMSKYWSKETICVDNCLVDEIKMLWDLGIITTGCCCGHNLLLPYVGVIDEYIDTMILLGYNIQLNSCSYNDSMRCDTFYPKTVFYTKEQYIKNVKNLLKNIK